MGIFSEVCLDCAASKLDGERRRVAVFCHYRPARGSVMTSFRTKFAVLFIAVLLLIACAVAQSNSDQSQTTDQNQTSDSTTQLNDQSGGTNPTRVIESHKV